MILREIRPDDLLAVHALLCEGFPRRSHAYWRNALEQLAGRTGVDGYPRYGFLLEVDSQPQGVMLLLTARVDGSVRSNLSSWYVREAYRKFATPLFQHTIRTKGGVYLNISPSDVVLPIIQAFGFKPYTNGTLLFTPRLLFAGGKAGNKARVRPLPVPADYGCDGFLLEDDAGQMEVLYRVKRLKRVLPAAQFVYGDPGRLCSAAGVVARALLRRAIPLAMADAPQGFVPPAGVTLMPVREIRYSKGARPPSVGDLRESEIAVFGT